MARESLATMMWEGLVLRGIAAILFGIVAVVWPGLTLITLVYIFSAFILATGVIGLGTGLMNLFKQEDGSILYNILLMLLAILEIGVGVYLLRHINVSFATFILLLGLVLIARGVIELVLSIFSGGLVSTTYRWLMFLTGILTIAVGAIILFQPVAGGVAFVWALGLYGIISGTVSLALAYDTKRALGA